MLPLHDTGHIIHVPVCALSVCVCMCGVSLCVHVCESVCNINLN